MFFAAVTARRILTAGCGGFGGALIGSGIGLRFCRIGLGTVAGIDGIALRFSGVAAGHVFLEFGGAFLLSSLGLGFIGVLLAAGTFAFALGTGILRRFPFSLRPGFGKFRVLSGRIGARIGNRRGQTCAMPRRRAGRGQLVGDRRPTGGAVVFNRGLDIFLRGLEFFGEFIAIGLGVIGHFLRGSGRLLDLLRIGLIGNGGFSLFPFRPQGVLIGIGAGLYGGFGRLRRRPGGFVFALGPRICLIDAALGELIFVANLGVLQIPCRIPARIFQFGLIRPGNVQRCVQPMRAGTGTRSRLCLRRCTEVIQALPPFHQVADTGTDHGRGLKQPGRRADRLIAAQAEILGHVSDRLGLFRGFRNLGRGRPGTFCFPETGNGGTV